MATPHLPDDILLQIVQRLPLRSVLLCKQVSKQWKHLINHPLFYKSYKDNSNRTAFFGSLDALYCVFINDIDDKAKELIHGRNLDSPPFTVHRVTVPLSYCNRRSCSSDNIPKFLGTSHGMACFKEEHGPFLVYNLFTGSLYTVANFPKNLCFGGEDGHRLRYYYGFGYDRDGDDYKILVYLILKGNYNPREDVWIYSFTNKDWNSFQGFPYQTSAWYEQDRVAYSINGVLHWSLSLREDRKVVIVTYDLHTNRFGEIQVPPTSLDGIGETVVELNGQLCYVRRILIDRNNSLFRRMNVWVMKEYGVGDSWERFATIDCYSGCIRRIVLTTLLHKCRGGRRLVLCNRDKQFEQRYEKALIWYNIISTRTRYESMVCPSKCGTRR